MNSTFSIPVPLSKMMVEQQVSIFIKSLPHVGQAYHLLSVDNLENADPMVREGCQHIRLPNYQFFLPAGRNSKKIVKVCSPFRAKPNPSWLWRIEVSVLFNLLG
jgi:hypothetical protein